MRLLTFCPPLLLKVDRGLRNGLCPSVRYTVVKVFGWIENNLSCVKCGCSVCLKKIKLFHLFAFFALWTWAIFSTFELG
jgi:hypothetical protein